MRGTRRTPRRVAAALAACALAACSVGEGRGEVTGSLRVGLCELNDDNYSFNPGFFVGDWSGGSLVVRLQDSGDNSEFTDELVFTVRDTAEVAQHLNEDLPVGPPGTAPVQVSLGLNRSCGRTSIVRRTPTVALYAYAGTINFGAIYNGDSTGDAQARRTIVNRFRIFLHDPRPARDYLASRPVGPEPIPTYPMSTGELTGFFDFIFVRGRPAQRFP